MKNKLAFIVEFLRILLMVASVFGAVLYAALSVGIEFFQRYLGFYIDGRIQTIVGKVWKLMNEIMAFFHQYDISHIILIGLVIIGLALLELFLKKYPSNKELNCFDE